MATMQHGPSLVFVGSSTEGLRAAEEIHDGLERPTEDGSRLCHATLWDQAFLPGDFVIDRLLLESEIYDYAVLVLSPDDFSFSRGKRQPCPRDNLNLEVGLFMARLGRKRCLIVRPSDIDTKLPSDLLGLCCIEYDHTEYKARSTDLRLQVNKLRRYIEDHGYRDRTQAFIKGWGYGRSQRLFAASLSVEKLSPYSNGQYSLLLACFGGEPKDKAFTTRRFALAEVWPIPKTIPGEVSLYVDCSMFAETLIEGDHVWGILFLIRGELPKRFGTLDELVRRGARVLDGKGNKVGPPDGD